MRTEEEGFALNDVGHDHSLLSSPQVGSGDPSEKGQDGFPIKNVGNDHSLLSSPQVVGGDPSEKGQDGFPIKNVGNDRDGDGFSINIVGNKEKIPFGTGLTEGGPSVLST